MRRFSAELPDGGKIAYGLDATLGGFWAEVRRPGRKRVAEYDALHPAEFQFERPLQGLLYFLVQEGAFTEPQLHDALLYLEAPTTTHRLPSGVKLAIEVVSNLKWAAAE